MRSLRFLLVASLLLLGSTAGRAASIPFTGTLTLQISTLPPITASGGGVAVVNGSTSGGHLTALALPAGAIATAAHRVPITDPAAAPFEEIQLTVSNGPATFAGSGGSGSFGGVMPLVGVAKVCLAGPCSVAVNNLSIPPNVAGSGGAQVVTAAVNLTVMGAPWTTGTVAIGTATAMGGVSPLSSTAMASFVTPVFVSTNTPLTVIPVFAFLSLSIPEPGTFALLAGGILGLVAWGRRLS